MKKFTIPPEEGDVDPSWYFLNRLNITACIEGVITFEDYSNLTNQKEN